MKITLFWVVTIPLVIKYSLIGHFESFVYIQINKLRFKSIN